MVLVYAPGSPRVRIAHRPGWFLVDWHSDRRTSMIQRFDSHMHQPKTGHEREVWPRVVEVDRWRVIIAIAFLIMMPGVLDYVGRLGKVLLLVFVTLAIALTVCWRGTKSSVLSSRQIRRCKPGGSTIESQQRVELAAR